MVIEAKILISTSVPIEGDNLPISIRIGRPLFILGRNGTGKSALVNRLSGQLGQNVIYMPGSRPSYFDNESLNLTPASRNNLAINLRGWDSSPDTRWRSMSGTQRNEKAVHDLQAAETQFKIDAANEIRLNHNLVEAIQRLQSHDSPLDRVNSLLAQASLPVQLIISGGELRAQQKGAIYSYARMSDGERSALVFAAEVVAAQPNSIFLIDEPELHLHPSIVVPLLTAFISERQDCAFIICTHELELPIACPGEVLLVRGGLWNGQNIVSWELDLLEHPEEIPEAVKVDLIGSRRKVLFIEGNNESLDQPLYSLLFPRLSVRAKESCKDVIKAVEGLRSVEATHRTQAFGLIDHDGMAESAKRDFEEKGIFPLPIFAVESLYYCTEALSAVAVRQSHVLGVSPDILLSEAREGAITSLNDKAIEYLASRIAERQMRDQLLREIPTRAQIASGAVEKIEISFASPFLRELELIKELVDQKDLEAIVSRYPVRESGILNNLAKGLRFSGRLDYERAFLQAVRSEPELQTRLKMKLQGLAAHLE